MSAAAETAVRHILLRLQRDPRLAYYFDPFTESFELLTAAEAERLGRPVEDYRKEFAATLKFERPPIAA